MGCGSFLLLYSVDCVEDDLDDLLADRVVGSGHPLAIDDAPEDHVAVVPAGHDNDSGVISGWEG